MSDVLDVDAARTQARRRLVGALVLLLIGIVGFPVLFETQPRPLPLDTPMEAVPRDSAVGGVVVKESARVRPVSLPPADAGTEELLASSAANTTHAASAPVAAAPLPSPTTAVVSAPVQSAKPTKAAVAAPDPSASMVASIPASVTAPAPPAPPAPPGAATAARPAAPASVDGTAARFVVQAGAYKESGKLHEARSKIESLGLKTYTQVVESDSGMRTRVRVGPFPTHQEAEAVAARIKRTGLAAAIVKL